MNQYIQDFIHVIQNGRMENTYKMAWARAIVETCVLNPREKVIHFDTLASKIFGYYWNQTIFFNLEQSPNPYKRAEIHQLVISAVESYKEGHGEKPNWFSRSEGNIELPTSRISSILSQDVCHRFLKIDTEIYNLYELDIANRRITLQQTELIKEHSDILFQLINYRWTQKLEEFNHSPRISKKVKGTDAEKIRRRSLTPFKELLDQENPDHICFYSGGKIDDEHLAIDHVLPWSYLYSDDLWNLVYVDKSVNSSKGNRIPNADEISKLEERNLNLLKICKMNNIKSKHIEELELAVNKDFVNKFWVSCKG